jgi:hypothetical protein
VRFIDLQSAERLPDLLATADQLCKNTAQRHDPCVIEVFMSVPYFMAG